MLRFQDSRPLLLWYCPVVRRGTNKFRRRRCADFQRRNWHLIKADGSFNLPASPYQSRKKSGIIDNIDLLFFDHPIHTLEFIGMKRSKIGIDNLAVNFSVPSGDLGDRLGGSVNDFTSEECVF